jgi:hypothetical protein
MTRKKGPHAAGFEGHVSAARGVQARVPGTDLAEFQTAERHWIEHTIRLPAGAGQILLGTDVGD